MCITSSNKSHLQTFKVHGDDLRICLTACIMCCSSKRILVMTLLKVCSIFQRCTLHYNIYCIFLCSQNSNWFSLFLFAVYFYRFVDHCENEALLTRYLVLLHLHILFNRFFVMKSSLFFSISFYCCFWSVSVWFIWFVVITLRLLRYHQLCSFIYKMQNEHTG